MATSGTGADERTAQTMSTSDRVANGSSLPVLTGAVKQLETAVRAHLELILDRFEVTTTQYTALVVLEERKNLTSAALARRSFVSAQSMGEVVRALEQLHLIERHADPGNRRRRLICLTPRGRTFLAQVAEAVLDVERRMIEGVSPDQELWLRQWIERTIRQLRSDLPS